MCVCVTSASFRKLQTLFESKSLVYEAEERAGSRGDEQPGLESEETP